jgi:hypothetical protein
MISYFFRLIQVAKLIAFFRMFKPLLHVDMETKLQEWSELNESDVWLSSGLILAHGLAEGNNNFANFLMRGEVWNVYLQGLLRPIYDRKVR